MGVPQTVKEGHLYRIQVSEFVMHVEHHRTETRAEDPQTVLENVKQGHRNTGLRTGRLTHLRMTHDTEGVKYCLIRDCHMSASKTDAATEQHQFHHQLVFAGI